MKAILDMNGVAYKRVALKSVYVASVAVTFQVDLVEEEQSRNISQLNSFVSNSESFSSFSSYSVMEDGRGSVDVTVAGKVGSIDAKILRIEEVYVFGDYNSSSDHKMFYEDTICTPSE